MWTGRVPRRVTRVDAPAAPAMAAKPIGRKCSPASRAESPRTCCRKIAVRKNMARNAAPFRARPRLAVCRPRVRNRRSGTSGAAERDSTTKKAAKRATAPASSATTSVAPQPSGSARITPSTSVRSPPVPPAPAAPPPRRPGPDPPDPQRQKPAGAERGPGDVQPTRAIDAGAALADEQRRGRDQGDADRHVDEEDALPADRIDEHAAGDDAERAAQAGETAPDAHGQVAVAPMGERHGQDRERRGGEQRAAQALGRTRGDEDAWRGREPGHERGAREERHAGHEHPAAAEQVTGAAAE